MSKIIKIFVPILTLLLGFLGGIIITEKSNKKENELKNTNSNYYENLNINYLGTDDYKIAYSPNQLIINDCDIYEMCSKLINSSYKLETMPTEFVNIITEEDFEKLDPKYYISQTNNYQDFDESFTFKICTIRYTKDKAIVDYGYQYAVTNQNKHDEFYEYSYLNSDDPMRIYLSFDEKWKVTCVSRNP